MGLARPPASSRRGYHVCCWVGAALSGPRSEDMCARAAGGLPGASCRVALAARRASATRTACPRGLRTHRRDQTCWVGVEEHELATCERVGPKLERRDRHHVLSPPGGGRRHQERRTPTTDPDAQCPSPWLPKRVWARVHCDWGQRTEPLIDRPHDESKSRAMCLSFPQEHPSVFPFHLPTPPSRFDRKLLAGRPGRPRPATDAF